MIKANRDDELGDFKRHINLIEYAESCGYDVDRKESSRASVVMRNGQDKIIVATGADGHGVYFSVRDDADHGTIIDFVQKRQGMNLGQVRRELRPWLKGTPATYQSKAPAPLRRKPDATNVDRQRAVVVWSKMQRPEGDHPYLTIARHINTATQADPRFIGMCRIDARENAVFPHYDDQGLSGYELKNTGWTGFSSGGIKSLWHTSNIEDAQQLVITESAIDALSHAEMQVDQDSAYASLGGQPSEHQWSLLAARMARMQRIVIATDNDEAGDKLAEKIKALAPPGAEVERQAPAGKDWNEDLIALKISAKPAVPFIESLKSKLDTSKKQHLDA